MIDAAGAVKLFDIYTPFGRLFDSAAAAPEVRDNPLMFTGQWFGQLLNIGASQYFSIGNNHRPWQLFEKTFYDLFRQADLLAAKQSGDSATASIGLMSQPRYKRKRLWLPSRQNRRSNAW